MTTINSTTFTISLAIVFILSLCCNIYFVTNDKNFNHIVSDYNSFQNWLNFTAYSSPSNRSTSVNNANNKSAQHSDNETTNNRPNSNTTLRILHIITSISEYDFSPPKHRTDRLKLKLIPAIQQITQSILHNEPTWEIDIYMVLGFKLNPNRYKLIKNAIPEGIGLEVWDDAIPYYKHYLHEKPRAKIRRLKTALARQHRYVLKDKYDYYDLFSCWEDDMIITNNHIQTYLTLSSEILRLAQNAPGYKKSIKNKSFKQPNLIKNELWWLIPGFMRVEVLKYPEKYERILHDNITVHESNVTINPMSCCNVPKNQSYSIASWETNIKAIRLLHIPNSTLLNYVGLLPCKAMNRYPVYPKKNSDQHNPQLFAQQAGWMLTKRQLNYIHSNCKGGILPPFDEPHWTDNALLHMRHNVEFWSGGYDFFFRCGVQRILSFDVELFSNQLVLHASNNKQFVKEKNRFVRNDDLFGQMLTLKENAMEEFGLK